MKLLESAVNGAGRPLLLRDAPGWARHRWFSTSGRVAASTMAVLSLRSQHLGGPEKSTRERWPNPAGQPLEAMPVQAQCPSQLTGQCGHQGWLWPIPGPTTDPPRLH